MLYVKFHTWHADCYHHAAVVINMEIRHVHELPPMQQG